MFSIKKRLAALIFLVTIISITVLSLSFVTTKPIKNNWNNYVDNVAQRQVLLSSIKSQFGFGGAIHNFKNYVLRHSDKYYNRIKSNLGKLDAIINDYQALEGISSQEKTALSSIQGVALKYNQATDTVKNMIAAGKTSQEIDAAVKINDSPAINAFKILTEHHASLTQEEGQKIDSQISFSSKTMVTAILIAAALVLIMVITLSHSILKPLSSLLQVIKQADKENNLTVRTKLSGHDEISQIGIAFDHMMNTFSHIITDINQSSKQLSSETNLLLETTKNCTDNISHQQDKTVEVTQAIDHINQSIGDISDTLADTSETASTTNTETQGGRQLLHNTIASIQALSEQIGVSMQVIHQLDANSEKINGVVDVIRGIAEQTNLLALNAAIEAARAGEQGRGFAVVADEVRTLAGRTQESTEEINKMISQLKTDTSQAVSVMKQSSEQAEIVVQKASQTGTSLDEISQSIETIDQKSVSVSETISQQSSALDAIKKNVEQINDMAHQSAEGARSSLTNVEHLYILTNELTASTSKLEV